MLGSHAVLDKTRREHGRRARTRFPFALVVLLALVAFPSLAQAGYTHYWRWLTPPAPEAVRRCTAEMGRLVAARPDLVTQEPRYEDGSEAVLVFNGIGENAHEPFVFPGRPAPDDVNFCKTFAKPYDAVVTASLLVARDCFPRTVLEILSDGSWADWSDGRELYTQVTGRAARNPLSRSQPEDSWRSLPGLPSGGALGMLAALAIMVFGWKVFGAGRRGGDGLSWSSYYLFWLVGPAAVAILSAHPLVLLIVPVGLVARRWLPDPYLWLRQSGRIRSLSAQIHANPHNATACRQLAMLYLEQRKPLRALPLALAALGREPDSAELLHLKGLCQLGAKQWEPALASFGEVLVRDPRFRYGDPFLRAADALAALGRWADVEEALDHFLAVNGSSLEGWYRRAQARHRRGDDAGARAARREARQVYAQLPRYQRRHQLIWYWRTFI